MQLSVLIDRIRSYKGLTRKKPIKKIFDELVQGQYFGTQLPNFGDDAAVIPWKDEYLLFAADGIMTGLLLNEPYAAGKAAVMVTVNDIYSMGGRPIAMVNVLAHGDERLRAEVVKGIKKGCEKLRVPMVGGHLHPDADPTAPSLSVAILGSAKNTLRCHLSEEGDDLILAVDLKGRPGCSSVVSWDANSMKGTDELLDRLEALPIIAERRMAHAAKDVSNAGILGTFSIMMENSGKGAVIDLASIQKPPEISFLDWLTAFMSFGFVLSVPSNFSQEVISLFHGRKISAKVVGRVIIEPKVVLRNGVEEAVLFDFNHDEITGIRYKR